MFDDLNRFRDELEARCKELNHLERLTKLADFLPPLDEITNQISFLKDYTHQIQEFVSHDSSLDSLKQLSYMKESLPSFRELEDIKKHVEALSPLKDVLSSLNGIENTKNYMNALSEGIISFFEKTTYIDDFTRVMKGIDFNSITELLNRRSDINIIIPPNSVHLTGTATVHIEEPIPNFQIEEAIQTILDSMEETRQSFEIKFNQLLEKIKNLKEPFIKKILIQVLLTILTITLIQPAIEKVKLIFSAEHKRKVIKMISKKTVYLDQSTLNKYRLVKVEVLNVRLENRTDSPVIGKLNFGALVRIIEKRKNWSLIEWYDKDEESHLVGWVFTRYVQRIN